MKELMTYALPGCMKPIGVKAKSS